MSYFGTVNIVVMVTFVLITLAIGVFYSVRDDGSEKLLISRSMHVLPVSLSMMATFLSAITIVGTPSEVFYHGMQLEVGALAVPVAGLLSGAVFLPVFHRLQLTSVYEYLGIRYGRRWMTRVATGAFMIQNLLYTAIVLVAPAVIVSSVLQVSELVAIAGIGVLGTTYTAFGGFRAVVWADVLQAFVMFAGIVTITIQGCINVGGLANMLEISADHGRTRMFDWNVDPLQRMNFWNVFAGMLVSWTSILGVNQPAVQRSLSLPSYTKSILMLAITCVFIIVLLTLAIISGLAIFSTYADCDPLASGQIRHPDEIVPHFVSEYFAHVPGLAGLFIACVLSGALSTISSSLNALAAVTWEDFLKHHEHINQLGANARAWILRAVALLFGSCSVAIAFVARNKSGLVSLTISVYGGASGPILGIFCLAVLVPFSNAIGAVSGLVAGLLLALWTSVGASFSAIPPHSNLATQVSGCDFNVTEIIKEVLATNTSQFQTPTSHAETSTLETLYSLSYMLFSVLGFSTSIVVGMIVSCATGGTKSHVDPDLLSPLVRCIAKTQAPTPIEERGQDNAVFEPDLFVAEPENELKVGRLVLS